MTIGLFLFLHVIFNSKERHYTYFWLQILQGCNQWGRCVNIAGLNSDRLSVGSVDKPCRYRGLSVSCAVSCQLRMSRWWVSQLAKYLGPIWVLYGLSRAHVVHTKIRCIPDGPSHPEPTSTNTHGPHVGPMSIFGGEKRTSSIGRSQLNTHKYTHNLHNEYRVRAHLCFYTIYLNLQDIF